MDAPDKMILVFVIIILKCIVAALSFPRTGKMLSDLDDADPFRKQSVDRLAAEENSLIDDLELKLDSINPVDGDYMVLPDDTAPEDKKHKPKKHKEKPLHVENDIDTIIDDSVRKTVDALEFSHNKKQNAHEIEAARNTAIRNMKKLVKEILNRIMPTSRYVGESFDSNTDPT
ncbi:uncharacterized protein LOC121391206 [Gigantopelta aegis]|uniref:uncharacterized protein LOC121391206 n=1 Tax=Gigantopelta aegis TaxID=1735272 RepID=UPI001B8875B2|nr:uncharacterized protein LOC121391206 [Gigantopelta aegis]